MKLLCLLFAMTLTLAAESLAEVKTVYLLPMSGGLDQHLAVSLTTIGVLQVVTDPDKADAIFTDSIGTSFEDRLKELSQNANKKTDGKTDDFTRPTMAPLSRGKGDIFLVDRKSHVVVWSMYATPKSSQSDDMNRLAEKIASQVQKDRKAK